MNAKRERYKLVTRRAGMRCSALLSEYEEDKEFCSKIRTEIAQAQIMLVVVVVVVVVVVAAFSIL